MFAPNRTIFAHTMPVFSLKPMMLIFVKGLEITYPLGLARNIVCMSEQAVMVTFCNLNSVIEKNKPG